MNVNPTKSPFAAHARWRMRLVRGGEGRLQSKSRGVPLPRTVVKIEAKQPGTPLIHRLVDTLRDYRRVWRRPITGSRWKEWLEARSVLILVQSDLIVPDGSPSASVTSAPPRRLHAESPRYEGPRSSVTCVDTRMDSKWRCSAESRPWGATVALVGSASRCRRL